MESGRLPDSSIGRGYKNYEMRKRIEQSLSEKEKE